MPRRQRALFVLSSLLILGAACAPKANSNSEDVSETTSKDTAGETTLADTPGEETVDVLSIQDAVTCPRADALSPAVVRQGSGDGVLDLHKVTLDAPGAVCNDGTPAVIFVRRAMTSENDTRWVIHLKGGGSCSSADMCRDRWCNEQSKAYSAGTMSSAWTADTINGVGLFRRADEGTSDPVDANPFAEWNNVFVYYCSSDTWAGDGQDVVMETSDGLRYRLQFRGHRIVDATLDALRAGATSDDGLQQLPPLESGALVLLVGSSAGGAGVTRNLDFVSQELGDAEVRGVIDAAFSPNFDHILEQLDPALASDVEAAFSAANVDRHALITDVYGGILETSCAESHPDDTTCGETGHIQRNHITTPFVVFSNLADRLLTQSYNAAGVSDGVYARALHRTLSELPNAPEAAEEGAQMSRAPGAFANACTQHTTLMSDAWFHVVTVSGVTQREALSSWLAGDPLLELAGLEEAGQNCAPVEDTGD